jgi:hypothetical protein
VLRSGVAGYRDKTADILFCVFVAAKAITSKFLFSNINCEICPRNPYDYW